MSKQGKIMENKEKVESIKKHGINKDLTPEEIKARNAYQKTLYEKKREKILARRRELHHEKHKEHKKNYYEKNIDIIKQKNKERYNGNDNKKIFYKQNRKRMLEYYYTNKTHLNEIARMRNNNRYKNEPNYKARNLLRSRLNYWLKGGQSPGCEEMTGLSIIELNLYIQSLFSEGMSWDNRKEWHIDHIKPVKLFDLTNQEQIKECYHYTNLRPMWVSDNKTKAGNAQ